MARRSNELGFRFVVAASLVLAGLIAAGFGLMQEGTLALGMVGAGAMLIVAGALVSP